MSKRTKYWVVPAILLILVAIPLGLRHGRPWYSQPQQIYRDNQDALEAIAEQYLADGTVSYPEIKGVIAVNAWPGDAPILEFITQGDGIAPAGTYRGIYYSVNGQPSAFQGGPQALIPDDEGGWRWQGSGDNGGRTRCIQGSWYAFEAHF